MCYLKTIVLSGTSDEEALNHYIDLLAEEKANNPSNTPDLVESFNKKSNVAKLWTNADRLLFQEKKPLDALDYYTVGLLIMPNHPQAYL